MGNIQSMVRKIQHFGTPVAASSPEAIEASDKIILPGVGHFGRAMEFLKEKHLIAPLNAAVIEHKKPILGVCLGMQLMTTRSEEGNVDGLGWIDAEVRQFRVQDNFKFKVPHVGWNKEFLRTMSSILCTLTMFNANSNLMYSPLLTTRLSLTVPSKKEIFTERNFTQKKALILE